jgi:hypothetical protein
MMFWGYLHRLVPKRNLIPQAQPSCRPGQRGIERLKDIQTTASPHVADAGWFAQPPPETSSRTMSAFWTLGRISCRAKPPKATLGRRQKEE